MCEKCFCHITDKAGNSYAVKDAYAREELAKIEERVDNRLKDFDANSGQVIAQMEEVNARIESGKQAINDYRDAAMEEVAVGINNATKDIYNMKTSVEQSASDVENWRDDIIARIDDATDAIVNLEKDIDDNLRYTENKIVNALNKKAAELKEGFKYHFGDIAAELVSGRIDLFTDKSNVPNYYRTGDIQVEVPSNFSRLTLFINICHINLEGQTRYNRFPITFYPTRFYSSAGEITNENDNVQVYSNRFYYGSDYYFEFSIRQTGKGLSNNKNTLLIHSGAYFTPDIAGNGSSQFIYGRLDSYILEVN